MLFKLSDGSGYINISDIKDIADKLSSLSAKDFDSLWREWLPQIYSAEAIVVLARMCQTTYYGQ